MSKKWYVVHTYSGYELKVKKALEEKVKTFPKKEMFGNIIVPSENVMELIKGQRKTTTRKIFPGYILVNMELNDETWHLVKDIPRVTGFVGGSTNPPAISDEEVEKIALQMEEGANKPKLKVVFEKGESVRVIDGPFSNFNGVVDEIKPEKGKVKVLVSIFGRSTPVELDFIQVEKN